MKKPIVIASLILGLLAASQAGETVVSTGKESKELKQVPVEECFKEHEFQIDIFGQYSVGEGPTHAGVFRDHGWGGGLGLNYFFTRNIALGVDAAWLDVKESAEFQRHNANHRNTALHNFTGSVIYRLPINHTCFAPYIYVGGGYEVDGEDWASAHAGVGLEYRVIPNKLGIFVDGRWTYLGDRDHHDNLNFFSTRAGFRVIF